MSLGLPLDSGTVWPVGVEHSEADLATQPDKSGYYERRPTTEPDKSGYYERRTAAEPDKSGYYERSGLAIKR